MTAAAKRAHRTIVGASPPTAGGPRASVSAPPAARTAKAHTRAEGQPGARAEPRIISRQCDTGGSGVLCLRCMEPFRPDLLAGKTTIVTGGGSGLGRSMAVRMGGLGAAVAVLGRRPAPLEETVKTIREAGGRAAAVPCDIRDPEAVRGAVDAVERELGPVNQLVNNAAGNFLAASEDLSPNAFDSVVRIVLYGTFHCTREVGARLVARKAKGEDRKSVV